MRSRSDQALLRTYFEGDRGDQIGTVTTFDDPAGYGTVTADDGTEHFFHCTAIADGSRQVDVGARVRFTVVPGRQGRWEAAAIRPAALST